MRPRKGTVIRKGTSFKARITMPDGSRPVVPLGTMSEAKARDMAAVLTEKAWSGKFAAPAPGAPKGKTMNDLLDAWLALVDKDPKYAPATRTDHRGNAKIIRAAFGDKEPQGLTTGVLRQWIRDMTVSSTRVRRRWCTLAKCIDNAMGEEWIDIPANPCRHPGMRGVLPSVEEPEEIVTLSDAQMARLLASPRRLRYLVARTSGMRDGEIAALLWSDLRLEGDIWVYDIAKTHAQKGGKRKPKTRAGRRLVPIHSAVIAALNLEGRTYSAETTSSTLFPGPSGGAHRPPSSEILTTDLGEKGYTFHALRRTFASALEKAGVPGDDQDRLIGHVAKSTRTRHYVAADLERLRAAVESSWQSSHVSASAPKSTVIPSDSRSGSSIHDIGENSLGDAIPRAAPGLSALGDSVSDNGKCAESGRGDGSVSPLWFGR